MRPTILKKICVIGLTPVIMVTASLSLMSLRAKQTAADVWQQLGITEIQAKENIQSSFVDGYLHYFGVKNIRTVLQSDRAAMANSILSYTKEFVNSPAFEKYYLDARETARRRIYPVTPQITREQLVKKKLEDAQSSLETFQKLLKTTTDPATIRSFKEQEDYWKKAITDYQDPNSRQIKYELDMDANRYSNEKEEFDKLTAAWEKKYPAKAVDFVKTRLAEFLDATTGIDYNAVIIDKGYSKVFANPQYEKKNWKWKMGFRAGKEATETARQFVQQWLSIR